MKPFNLEEAKAGKPVCTRDGRDTRIICFDRADNNLPIVALVIPLIEDEVIKPYTIAGTYYIDRSESPYDLFMKSEKKTGWINIYDSESNTPRHREYTGVYRSKEEAINGKDGRNYVTTIEISWEE